jgi:hypothetical protein
MRALPLVMLLTMFAPAYGAGDWSTLSRHGYAMTMPEGYGFAEADDGSFLSADGTILVAPNGGVLTSPDFASEAADRMQLLSEEGWTLLDQTISADRASGFGWRGVHAVYWYARALCDDQFAGFLLIHPVAVPADALVADLITAYENLEACP